MSGCRQYVTPWLFSMCGMTRGLRKLTGEQWWDPFVYVLLWGLVLKRARCQTNHLQQWNLNGLHCCILLYAVRFCFNAVCVSFFCLCIKYLWNCCADLHQIHMEDVFGPSLERVWVSRSKVKDQRHQGQKRHFGPLGGLRAVYVWKNHLCSSLFTYVKHL